MKKFFQNTLVQIFLAFLGYVAILMLGAWIHPIVGYIIFGLGCSFVLFLTFVGIANVIRDGSNKPKRFTIKKGKHYCNHGIPAFGFINKTYSVTRTFRFSKECLYTTGSTHINKLWGHTHGLFPRRNSNRWGWNCARNDGSISLYAYVYKNGQRDWKYIASVPPEADYDYTFRYSDDKVSFFLDDDYLITCNINQSRFVVENYPYFGGSTETAPHDMDIYRV